MKLLKYKVSGYVATHNPDTDKVEQVLSPAEISVECKTQSEFNNAYAIAEKTAIPGTIEVSGAFDYPTATHNITAGEYVTINGTLYKATESIPNGERIIVGQNAIETTIEEQLNELKGE